MLFIIFLFFLAFSLLEKYWIYDASRYVLFANRQSVGDVVNICASQNISWHSIWTGPTEVLRHAGRHSGFGRHEIKGVVSWERRRDQPAWRCTQDIKATLSMKVHGA